MLTEKKKAYFRKLLKKQLDGLLEQPDLPLSEHPDLKERASDFADQAAMESDLGFTLRIKERESRLVLKIEEALERLEGGTFGICESCGEKISEARLKARPVATLCIECKKESEADEKRRGS